MSCARHASSAAAVFEASNVAADGALHSRQSVLRLAAGLALSLAPASPPAVRAAGDEDAERILAGYETVRAHTTCVPCICLSCTRLEPPTLTLSAEYAHSWWI